MHDGADAPARETPSVQRLLGLSDGVVAIALTLLVLQIAVPTLAAGEANSARALGAALRAGAPQMVAYLVSFYVIAQFWLAHHRVFQEVHGHSEGLAWWNFLFLLTITLMPFTSALLGRYSANPLAVTVFAANLMVASLSTLAVLAFGRRWGLTRPDTDPAAFRASLRRSLLVVVVVAASMSLAWFTTAGAKVLWLGLLVVPRVAAALGGRAERRAAVADAAA